VTIFNARIEDAQLRTLAAANRRFIARQQEQPRAGRVAIHRE